MIIIPTGTDAPIYHWPYATVGLILINIALFIVVPPPSSIPRLDDGEDEAIAKAVQSNFGKYSLTIGDGHLDPKQWVTHNFLHDGIGQLLGNILFIWAFGIVVEGKLGIFKYLLVYLSIGTLHGLFLQLLMPRSDMISHLAGASAVVYGLLAACMVWAPRNELSCLVIILVGLRGITRHCEFYFTTVALFYVGGQVLTLVFWHVPGELFMSSELAHLSGAFWGAALSLALLKLKLVDCEGWDILSLWSKNRDLARDWKARGDRQERSANALRTSVKNTIKAKAAKRDRNTEEDADSEARRDAAIQKVQTLIERGDLAGAATAYDKSARTLVNWPPQPALLAMIKALQARGAEVESVRMMRDHCRYYPAASTRLRLKLAQVLTKNCQRPAAALKVLNEIPPGSLDGELEVFRKKLALQATQMCEDGVLELEGDD
ncbi:rhomboid family intramembrane serine protease [Singulisphaera rosea]